MALLTTFNSAFSFHALMAPSTPPATPMASTFATTTASATAPDVSRLGTIVARDTAGVEPRTSSAPTAIVRIPCAGTGGQIQSTDAGIEYNFRGHAMVKHALAVFSIVNLVEVRIFVHQRSIFSAGTADFSTGAKAVASAIFPHHFRLGVAPNGLVTHTGTGSTRASIAHGIPGLRSFMTSSNIGTSATFEFASKPGPGAFPFPPGLQLDLRAAEVRHKWPVVLIANASLDPDAVQYPLAHIQVDFVVECSGSNFGSIPA